MKKTIEIKVEGFLKGIKLYALKKKKEKPLKLPMPPDALAAFRVKFTFARVEEISLEVEGLSFFKERLGIRVKARATDSDPSKTYYVAYLEALLNELAKFGIYAGQTVEDRLASLSAWMGAVRDGKVIVEVIAKAALAPANASIGIEDREKGRESGELGEESDPSFIETPSLDWLTETTREEVGRYKRKIGEQELAIAALEATVRACREATKEAAKEREYASEVAQVVSPLQESLEQVRLEVTGHLRILEEEMVRLRTLPQNGEELEDRQKKSEKGEERREAAADTLAAILQEWTGRLVRSRNGLVTVPLCGRDGHDGEETLPRFLAIARLEAEKAAHFASHNGFWPKEGALETLKVDGYEDDLGCLFLYKQEDFPRGLRMFAVLFAFWEAGRHNRFYSNAFSLALNSGSVPANLGISPDTAHEDALLKILHSADMMRILMGHYGAIAQSQFDITLFPIQEETMAQFGEGLPDIARTSMEGAVFV